MSAGAIARKYAIITIGTLAEAYLSGVVEYIARECGNCGNSKECLAKKKCPAKKRRKGRGNYTDIRELFEKVNDKEEMLTFNDLLMIIPQFVEIDGSLREELERLREIRNHIHVQYIEKDKVRVRDYDKNKSRYTLKEYNKAIAVLRQLPALFERIIHTLEQYRVKKTGKEE
ncbi:hypothetical protein [Fervidobacterium gondwanense]|uniref:hypothetical protein n=2 Tax=Fervidobacterium gondwanense TaxID=44754 RepID=UPI003C7083DC